MTIERELINKVKIFRPISQDVRSFNPNLNDWATQVVKFMNSKDNRFKMWIFTNKIELETPLNTSLFFSINYPDKVCLAKTLLMEISGIGKIFTDSLKDEQIQLCLTYLDDSLKSLVLDKNEGLTVYKNSLQLILNTNRQILPEVEICNIIKSIIEENFPVPKNDYDYNDIPNDLRLLIKRYAVCAISDDFEREEKITELTRQERTYLIEEIEPKINDINNFLNTFGDKPLTIGAIKLQNLCELVIELKLDK